MKTIGHHVLQRRRRGRLRPARRDQRETRRILNTFSGAPAILYFRFVKGSTIFHVTDASERAFYYHGWCIAS